MASTRQTATATTVAAGKRRRALLAWKWTRLIPPEISASFGSRLVIKYPETTKNISTPISPPGRKG
jgi:hypothetical protein